MQAPQTLSRIKLPGLKAAVFAFFIVALLAVSIVARSARTAAAATPVSCTPTGTTYGTLTFSQNDTPSNPIDIIAPTGTAAQPYNLWVRLQVPSASSNALLLNIDNATGNNCYNVDGTITPNTWTWVNVAQPTLTPGDHQLVVTGLQSGAELDRIEFLSDSTCTPTGTGDNCITAATTATPPTVSVTAPSDGQTVSGTVSVTVTAAGTDGAAIASVQFQVDDQNVGGADTNSPYTYSLDTTTLSPGTHTIRAIATDNNNPAQTTTSASVSITVNNAQCTASATPALAAPTGLIENPSSPPTYTTIGLKWTAPAPTTNCTISGYNIYRDNGTTPVNGGTLISGTTYTDSGLTAGTNHTYTVQAVDSGPNTSAKSASSASFSTTADNLAPNVPTGLNATAANASQVNLSWTGSTDLPSPGGTGVAGYNIYRCTGSSCTPSLTTPVNGGTPVNGTSYPDTTVSSSTAYNYVVTAVDNSGNESAPSTSDNATTPAPTCSGNPSQPGTPTAGARSVQSLSFSWTKSTASAGCTLNSYHIYQVNGSTYTLITTAANTATPSVTISTNLTPNTSYVFAVEAFDTSGHTSDRTNPAAQITIATTPDTTAPTAPTPVTAALNGSQVVLGWPAATDNVGVTSYKIYRCTGSSCSNFAALAGGTVTATAATSYSFPDTTVAASTSYTYQVSALDGANNESSKTTSNAVTTPSASPTKPAAPGSPQAPIIASQSAHLTWTAPSGTVTGYHIYIDGVLDNAQSDTTTFGASGGTLSCLAPGITYNVTVMAYNSAGNSPAAAVSVPTPTGGLAGDFNCDGHVNGFDLNPLASNWLSSGVLPSAGDANGDTVVNGFDLNALASNWNK